MKARNASEVTLLSSSKVRRYYSHAYPAPSTHTHSPYASVLQRGAALGGQQEKESLVTGPAERPQTPGRPAPRRAGSCAVAHSRAAPAARSRVGVLSPRAGAAALGAAEGCRPPSEKRRTL